ncbi:unnamed protein product [Gadus morhua 'NCC']
MDWNHRLEIRPPSSPTNKRVREGRTHHDFKISSQRISSFPSLSSSAPGCHGTCALRIRDLRRSDSAVYKFRFTTNQPGVEHTGEPGVKLSVTDLQVKVSFPYPTIPTWTNLECHSRCGLAEDPRYIWFRNGQHVGQGVNNRVVTQFGDSYSCAVEGYALRSPSVYAPKTPSVTVRPSGELEEGSSVTLSCSSDANPAANYNLVQGYTDRSYIEMKQGPQVIFRSILSKDSGQYCCIAQTELRTSKLIYISVKYAPKTPSVTLSPSVRPEDRGRYSCHAENKYGQLSSNSIIVDVQYAPKNLSVTVSPSGELEEGSSVTLSCSSDAVPAANYTWFKKKEGLQKSMWTGRKARYRAGGLIDYQWGHETLAGRKNSMRETDQTEVEYTFSVVQHCQKTPEFETVVAAGFK